MTQETNQVLFSVEPEPEPLQQTLWTTIAGNARLLGLFSALLALLVYGNTVLHGFAFDDSRTIENNPLLASETFWSDLFNADYFLKSGESTFRPLVTISY